MTTLTLTITILAYISATLMVIRSVRAKPSAAQTYSSTNWAFCIGIIAAVTHIAYASQVSIVNNTLDFGLSSMIVLISGILVALYILGGLIMPIKRLGILVFPVALVSLIFSIVWTDEVASFSHMLDSKGNALNSHILISVLAIAILGIATIQAILYAYQEQQIKSRTHPTTLVALPPLQTMEQLLFRLLAIGFFLLTLTLVSGALFSREIFGHAFEFKHHTILAVLGWCVYAVLLLKRINHGIRGSHAAIWTVSAFVLILLGYFGTKLVTDILST